MARTRRYDKDRSYARFDQTLPVQLLSDLTPRWHAFAQCLIEGVDPDRFFPHPGAHGNQIRAVTRVCNRCLVRLTCKVAGRGEHGIWGGFDEPDRSRQGHMSLLKCNFDPCHNLLLQKLTGPRRYYCCRLHRDRAARQPRRPRADDGTPLQPPLPTNQWTPVRGLAIPKRNGRSEPAS